MTNSGSYFKKSSIARNCLYNISFKNFFEMQNQIIFTALCVIRKCKGEMLLYKQKYNKITTIYTAILFKLLTVTRSGTRK